MVSLVQIATSVVLVASELLVDRKRIWVNTPKCSCFNSQIPKSPVKSSGKIEINVLEFFGLCMWLKQVTHTFWTGST